MDIKSRDAALVKIENIRRRLDAAGSSENPSQAYSSLGLEKLESIAGFFVSVGKRNNEPRIQSNAEQIKDRIREVAGVTKSNKSPSPRTLMGGQF